MYLHLDILIISGDSQIKGDKSSTTLFVSKETFMSLSLLFHNDVNFNLFSYTLYKYNFLCQKV